MTISLQVLYPIKEDTNFNYEYYLNDHNSKIKEAWEEHVKEMFVTKGNSGGPDTPPAYYAIYTFLFETQSDFDNAMSKLPPLLEDIPNYTNVEPQILIGEVAG
tara:strand:+ start:194 stop:502 length:309 start_codon:yes stop_codon:yes gene_type:complete